MKILFTGATTLSVGTRGANASEGSLVVTTSRLLPTLGHEVDQREVTPGEPLRGKYDLAIIGLHGLYSVSTFRLKFGALWAASQLPCLVLLDDWRWKSTLYSLCGLDLFWRVTHVLDNTGADKAFEAGYKYRKEISAQYERWRRKLPVTIASVHPWGSVEPFLEQHKYDRFVPWDPTPHLPQLFDGNVEMAEKRREWVLPALQQEDEWLERVGLPRTGLVGDGSSDDPQLIGWPVIKQYKPTLSQHGTGWDRIPERDVSNKLYRYARGALCPTRRKGADLRVAWYRPRIAFALQAGCVVWGEPVTMARIGDAFQVPHDVIEQSSDSDLNALVLAQTIQFQSRMLKPRDSAAILDQALTEAAIAPAPV